VVILFVILSPYHILQHNVEVTSLRGFPQVRLIAGLCA
jgi:hypothetical protein